MHAQETPCLEIEEEKISKKDFVCYARGVVRVYIGEGTLSLLLIIIFSVNFFHSLPFCMSNRLYQNCRNTGNTRVLEHCNIRIGRCQ